MTLRCKPGDLAIIVKSVSGNEGKIVVVGKFLGNAEVVIYNKTIKMSVNDYWEIDRPIRFTFSVIKMDNYGISTTLNEEIMLEMCSDACLRPLNGDLSEDEINETLELEIE